MYICKLKLGKFHWYRLSLSKSGRVKRELGLNQRSRWGKARMIARWALSTTLLNSAYALHWRYESVNLWRDLIIKKNLKSRCTKGIPVFQNLTYFDKIIFLTSNYVTDVFRPTSWQTRNYCQSEPYLVGCLQHTNLVHNTGEGYGPWVHGASQGVGGAWVEPGFITYVRSLDPISVVTFLRLLYRLYTQRLTLYTDSL